MTQPQFGAFAPQGQQFAPQGQPQADQTPQFGQPQAGGPGQAAGQQFAPQGFGQQPQGQQAVQPGQQPPQFGQQPQAGGFAPQFGQQQPQAQPGGFGAAQGQQAGGDPFGQVPEAPPAAGGISSDDVGAVIVMRCNSIERGVPSQFKNEDGSQKYQDRLHVDALFVTGPRAGEYAADAHIYWTRVTAQFANCCGDGKPYLVQVAKDGRSIALNPVTDPGVRAQAAQMMAQVSG